MFGNVFLQSFYGTTITDPRTLSTARINVEGRVTCDHTLPPTLAMLYFRVPPKKERLIAG